MNAIDTISRALRRIGVLAAGDFPDEATLNDAIETLKAIILRIVSEGGLGELKSVIASDGDFTAREFSRVLRNSIETSSISLPDTVTDETTGATRAPLSGAVIVVTDIYTAETVTYIYDGDLNQWLGVETMDSTSIVPFSARDANGLASYLAVELADEYGQDIKGSTAMAAQRFHSSLIHDWSREIRLTPRPENYF